MSTPTPHSDPSDRTIQWCPNCSGGKDLAENCRHPGSQIMQAPEPGTSLAEDYQYISTLGVGGMGVVYKCRHLKLDKIVAVKTLVASQFGHEDLIRFQREAKAAGKFNHANLVSILDFGITHDGTPFMSMEYLEGTTLEQALANGDLEIEEMLRIFEECCEGLAYAHRHKVLHRDLKPANIMLVGKNTLRTPKILDFGIAKIADAGQSAQSMTRTGAIFGTPPYMSPEQCAGDVVTEQSDVYSLGCVMYESFAGRRPFIGKSAFETFEMHRMLEPEPVSAITRFEHFPKELDELILQMLSKEPQTRPSMGSLRWELEQILLKFLDDLEQRQSKKKEIEALGPTEAKSSQRRNLFAVVATVLILGIICCGWLISNSQQPVHTPRALNHDMQFFEGSRKILPENQEEVLDEMALNQTRKNINKRAILFREGDFTLPQARLLGHEAKNCRVLQLYRNLKVTKDKLHELRNMDLRELRIARCDITDDGLNEVLGSQGNKLESLVLLDNKQLTDNGLQAVLRCKKLKSLRLQDLPQLRGGTAQKILLAMPKLTSLELSFAPDVKDEDLRPLARMNLSDLVLSGTGITDETLNNIQKNRNLARLYLDGTNISEAKFVETFKHLAALGTVSIGQTKISESVVKVFAAREARPQATRLYWLELDGLNITTKSFPYFPRFKQMSLLSLRNCPKLTQHDIDSLRKLMPANCMVRPGDTSPNLELIPSPKDI